jgi:hypothetical protein
VILQLSTQPFPEELCLVPVGVHMENTVLHQVIEYLAVLIDVVRSLLQLQEILLFAAHEDHWNMVSTEYNAKLNPQDQMVHPACSC